MTAAGGYKLVCSIFAHDGPIRCLSGGKDQKMIITGCQSDSPNVKGWTYDPPSLQLTLNGIFHDHWVTALTALQPDQSRMLHPEGCIVTGCMDSKIRVFDFQGNSLSVLVGHLKGVISFDWTNDMQLLSGSWDGSAKVWDLAAGVVIHTLGPHENGVHVLGLSNGNIATTSTGESVNGKPANFRLRLWDGATGTPIGSSIEDHSGSIRSITRIAGLDGFATSSNDGTVILRSSDGSSIGTMFHPPQDDGSPPFILDVSSLSSLSGMDSVSCGEDGSVVVWCGTEMLQSIPHPCCVWCVMGIPGTDGDFVTGGNDGVLRLFSKDPSKTGAEGVEQLNKQFSLEVSSAKEKRKTGPSSEEVAKAPKWDQRGSTPGRSENQVMVFNREGSLIAAQWMNGAWVVVGEVTGTGEGGHVGEVWYDRVMPVEMETPSGVRTLKLGHNNGDNPFVSAQRFIDQNDLPQSHLGQIADWIVARSGSSAPTFDMTSGGHSTAPTTAPTASAVSVSRPFSQVLTGFVAFDDNPQRAKVQAKLVEFNLAMSDTEGFLSDEQLAMLDSLMSTLEATSRYHVSIIRKNEVDVLMKMAMKWTDPSKLFPVFDLLRMVAIHPSGSEALSSASLFIALVTHSIRMISEQTGAAGFPTATALTVTRFFVNSLRSTALRSKLVLAKSDGVALLTAVLRSLAVFADSSNKSVRIALATLVMNVAAVTTQYALFPAVVLSDDSIEASIGLASKLLCAEKDSAEVAFRTLRAVGTLRCNVGVDALAEYIQPSGLKTALDAAVVQWGSRSDVTVEMKTCVYEVQSMFV